MSTHGKMTSRPSSASIKTIDFNYDEAFDASLGDLETENAAAAIEEAATIEEAGHDDGSSSTMATNTDWGGSFRVPKRNNSLHVPVTKERRAGDVQQAGESGRDGSGDRQGSFSKDKAAGGKSAKRGRWQRFRGPLVALTVAAVFGVTFYVSHQSSERAKAVAAATAGYADLEGVTDAEAANTNADDSSDAAVAAASPRSSESPTVQEMPHPKSPKGAEEKYGMAFPHSLNELAETISPQFREEEMPVLFSPTDAGSNVVERVLQECHKMVVAGENGREMEWRNEPLSVLDEGGRKFVNVDLQSEQGISRAASLNLVESGLVDYVSSSSLLHRTISSLFSTNSYYRGRMVAFLHHPVDLAMERYYDLTVHIPDLASLTVEDYAAGDLVEENVVTRLLSGRVQGDDSALGPLGKTHLDLAKEVLRRKALVLLQDETTESIDRTEKFFGLGRGSGQDVAECRDALLKDYLSVVADRAKKYGPPPQVDDPAYLQLMQRNQLDADLYEYAKELFAVQKNLPVRLAEPFDEERWKPGRNCVENGRFVADPPVSNWYAVQSNLQVVSGRGGKGNALKATDRGHQIFGGMWQNLNTECLRVGEWYEVHAMARTTTRGTDDEHFECDPTILYNNVAQSCPAVGVRVGERMREIGLTFGPVSSDQEWIDMYGAFQATSEMTVKTVSTFVSRTAPDVDLAVDHIQISPASASAVGIAECSTPIVNGDAEVGDHRFWFIRGTQGGGRIEIVSPGYGKSKHAFRHAGSREQRYRGMLQRLDASCFTEGTMWTITAQFRYFSIDENGKTEPTACQKDNPKAKDSCPVFDMDFISPNGAKVNTGPLQNEAPGDVKLDGWNEIRHTLTVTPDMALRPQVLIYINSVDPSYNYDLDDIRMERIDNNGGL